MKEKIGNLGEVAIGILNELHTERLDYESEYLPLVDCAQRCAAYEETGLLPEEVVKMGMMLEDSRRYSDRLELKLKPYLDIGLGPSELNALKLASVGKCVVEIKEFDGIAIDRLRKLAQAEKDGRLVVLPCKVGDTVYARNHNGRIVDGVVESIHQNYVAGKAGRWVVTVYYPEYNRTAESGLHPDFLPTTKFYGLDDFGKTVFPTHEEAGAALKGGGE